MVATLWWVMASVSMLLLLIITGIWLYCFRDRRRSVSVKASRNHFIIFGGILLPSISIILLLVIGIPIGYQMLPLPTPTPLLKVEVVGHQWWFEVRYVGTNVTEMNHLHLPQHQPVDLRLTSTDVIHSFWVPSLGGKMDMVPGHENHLRLYPNKVGKYRGQCAEFCGRNHALMFVNVDVQTQENFEVWLRTEINRRQNPRV